MLSLDSASARLAARFLITLARGLRAGATLDRTASPALPAFALHRALDATRLPASFTET